MIRPVRLQLSRRPGFKLQVHSRSVNGLPASKVTRPGKWGNPFKATEIGPAEAVARYRAHMADLLVGPEGETTRLAMGELRGRNLACWCAPGEPCHAEILLELANRSEEAKGLT